MRGLVLAALLAPVAVTASARVEAQNPGSLVGKWAIEYERGRRMVNGEATIITGKGTVSIAQTGDSLVATFETGPRPDGTSAPPSTAIGRMTPDGAVFVQKQTVTVNMNGDEQQREITATWTLQANGDALTGTIARTLPGMADGPPPGAVKGTRVASQ